MLKRARATKHPWLIACDADMSPEDFETSLCFRKGEMHVTAPEGVSTCRSKKGAKGAWVDKVYEYAIACNSSQEQRMPKVLPGYSGGRLPGRSTEEKGREEGEEDEGSGERSGRNQRVKEVVKGMQKKAVDESAENEGKKTERPDLMRSWDCSQIGNEEEE